MVADYRHPIAIDLQAIAKWMDGGGGSYTSEIQEGNNTTMLGFIDDGHTVTETLPEIPGVMKCMTITYRPLTARENTRLWDNFAKLSADAKFERQRDALVSHLISWDCDKPITTETFETIESPHFEALIAEVARLGGRFKPAASDPN